MLKIDDYEIQENAWVEMIRNLTAYLISTSAKSKEDIVSFKTQWSKQNIFSLIPRTNYKQLDSDLYVNCNHTALHSCWLIQDLLDFFGIDKSKVYFVNKFKEEVSLFLKEQYSKSDEDAKKIISNIEKFMDPILAKFSKSYNSFMLFEDSGAFSNYSKKFRETIDANPAYKDKVKRTMERYLFYLNDFYHM